MRALFALLILTSCTLADFWKLENDPKVKEDIEKLEGDAIELEKEIILGK